MFVFFRRTLIPALIAGILAGWMGVVLLLVLDVGGLGSLVMASGHAVLAILLLMFGFSVTFGSAAMGAVIIAIGTEDAGPRSGRRKRVMPLEQPELALVRVKHNGAHRA